jgi:hypothetical protein
MANYNFYGWFVASKTGATALAVTVDVRNSAGSAIVTGGTATEIGGGVYKYTYSGTAADDYVAVFKTTDTTVDAKHVPSLVPVQLPYIDTTISSRLAPGGTVLPAGGTVAIVQGGTVVASSSGGGAIVWDHYVDDGTNPLGNVYVEVSTDTAKSNVIASGYTASSGTVTFNIDAGTYYFWKELSGYNFENPETVVIS